MDANFYMWLVKTGRLDDDLAGVFCPPGCMLVLDEGGVPCRFDVQRIYAMYGMTTYERVVTLFATSNII